MTDTRRDALVLGLLVAALLWAGAVGVMAWRTFPMFKAAILDECSRSEKKWGMPWEQGRVPSESACAHTQPHKLPWS